MGSGVLSPHTRNDRLNLFLEAFDEFAVGVDEGLFRFNLGDYGFLGFENRNWKLSLI